METLLSPESIYTPSLRSGYSSLRSVSIPPRSARGGVFLTRLCRDISLPEFVIRESYLNICRGSMGFGVRVLCPPLAPPGGLGSALVLLLVVTNLKWLCVCKCPGQQIIFLKDCFCRLKIFDPFRVVLSLGFLFRNSILNFVCVLDYTNV